MPAAFRLVLAFAVACVAADARAEVWVYVDPAGKSHFANHRVDDRYSLFFKGRSTLDPPPPAPPAPAAEPAPPTAAERLRDHPTFRRVDDHPNVGRFARLVDEHARANDLDPALVRAVIAVESAFEPAAVSPKGAVGLMQVMPDTGERWGVTGDAKRSVSDKLAEPSINVRVGTRHLREMLARYAGDLTLALAAYNAGEGAVDRHGGVPPYAETREYVRLVALFHDWYRPPAPVEAPAPPAPPAVEPGPAIRLDLPGKPVTRPPPK